MIRPVAPHRDHCMVVHNYYPIGEPRVQREADALVDAGLQVDVICLRDRDESPVEVLENGVRVFRMPVRRDKRRGLSGQLLEYIAFFILASIQLVVLHIRCRYQVIQVHNLPDFLVFVALLPCLMGAAVILDLHDLMPEFFIGRYGADEGRLALRLVRWQERISCWFADHVITVSEHWRLALIRRGVPAHKVSVVMNVADDQVFNTQGRRVKPRTSNEFKLIYHGTIVYRYGLDLVIRAVDRVRREIPGVQLMILGRGEHVPALIQLVDELGLEKHVTIYNGLRPVEELPSIIREADVGVVAYRNDVFTDGLLPTKLMEYAALDLPCIAARTTAIKAYFSDTLVEFFEPGDVDDLAWCIRRLFSDPGRRADLAEGCHRFKQKYNWPSIKADYVAIVDQLGARNR